MVFDTINRRSSSGTHLVDVPQPLGDVVECFGVGDVVDEHDAHSSAVVGRRDGVEPLLPRCVPAKCKLQLPVGIPNG